MAKQYFQYDGNAIDLLFIMFRNLVMTIFTLGIYRPWARTNSRRYLWSHVLFQGDRGAYSGTGAELFEGWLKLFGVFILFVIGVNVLGWGLGLVLPSLVKDLVVAAFTSALYLYIFSLAVYSGLRYRMTRTSWRQIRFGVERDKASASEFSRLYIKGFLYSIFTLGLYAPYFKNDTHKYLVDRSHIGTKFLRYSGEGSEYFRVYFTGFLLCIVTFGIYIPWFIRDTLEYRLQHTHMDEARFGIDVQGSELLVFALVGYLLTLLTAGIASPWILDWGYRLFINKIYIEGDVSTESIAQSSASAEGGALAEDVVDAYDLDLGF